MSKSLGPEISRSQTWFTARSVLELKFEVDEPRGYRITIDFMFLDRPKTSFLQEFGKPSFCYENIFYEPEAVFSLRLISLQSATSTLSGFNFSGMAGKRCMAKTNAYKI
jgi:hypothetical protein